MPKLPRHPPGMCVCVQGEGGIVISVSSLTGGSFFRLACFRFAAGKAASPVVHDVKQSKSVADARAVEGPALSVDEPSEQLKSVADARAVEGLCLFPLRSGQGSQPRGAMVHDVKQSESVADVRAVEGPA